MGVNPFDWGSPAPAASLVTSNTLAPGGTELTSIDPLVFEIGGEDGFAVEVFDCDVLDCAVLDCAAFPLEAR